MPAKGRKAASRGRVATKGSGQSSRKRAPSPPVRRPQEQAAKTRKAPTAPQVKDSSNQPRAARATKPQRDHDSSDGADEDEDPDQDMDEGEEEEEELDDKTDDEEDDDPPMGAEPVIPAGPPSKSPRCECCLIWKKDADKEAPSASFP